MLFQVLFTSDNYCLKLTFAEQTFLDGVFIFHKHFISHVSGLNKMIRYAPSCLFVF